MNFLRRLLMAATVFSVLLGIAALGFWFLGEPKWQSQAVVTQSDNAALGNYYSLYSTYHLVQEKQGDAPAAVAYRTFTQKLTSPDILDAFWKNTEYYKQQLTDDAKQDAKRLADLTQSVTVDTQNGQTTVRLVLNNPKQATELLSALLVYLNTETRTTLYDNLIFEWKSLFSQVKNAAEAGLNGDWQAKLTMMRSVSPLDEQFNAYHSVQKPTMAERYRPFSDFWVVYSAVTLLLITLNFCFRKRR